jgi:hypothetical protein
MKLAIIFSICIMFSFAAQSQSKATCKNPKGAWLNTIGSTMTIKNYNTSSGSIDGIYETPSLPGQIFPLVGWVNELPAVVGKSNTVAISFSVRWGKVGSITSWTCTCANNTIRAPWHLVSPVTQFSWDHFLTDLDVFQPK